MLIRSITEKDYPQATEIHNAQNEPHWQTTPEHLRRSDEVTRRDVPRYRRYVAEENGEVIAVGYITPTWAGTTIAGRVWTSIFTRKDYRNKGVDAQLLEHAITEFEQPVKEVWSCVREDFLPMSGYLKGFTEAFRSFGSELHLSEFDSTKFTSLLKRLEKEGIVLERYTDLSSDSKDKLLALHAELEPDVPHHEPIIPAHYPDIQNLETDQSSVMVALKDGQAIGYVSLETDDRAEKTGIAFLGVLHPYRDQGVGTALGAKVIEYAKTKGYSELGTGGAKENVATQRVLLKLGFEIEPEWVTFSKAL